jgi:hypothetical protein
MRIVETRLNNGDQVRLGSVEMRFESDTKKSSQPLPPTHAGVDLSQVGAGSAPPPTFGTSSPFGRKRKGKSSYLIWGVLVLGLLALALVGYFFIKILGTK